MPGTDRDRPPTATPPAAVEEAQAGSAESSTQSATRDVHAAELSDPADRPMTAVATRTGASQFLSWVPRLGVWAWSFVGFVAATFIVVAALAAVNEIVLPLTFAAVLAVVFRPWARVLQRHQLKPSIAAGAVVLGLLGLVTLVTVATVQGVLAQMQQIGTSVNAAVDEAALSSLDPASMETLRAAVIDLAPAVQGGFLNVLVSGVSTAIGFASGLILGTLIMYYLLKDGAELRRSLVAWFDPQLHEDIDSFISDSCRTLRDYGRGRTVMSAIVAAVIGLVSLVLGLPLVFTIVVVNFIGGYIPYIGAFLGGGLAVIVALGDRGLGAAAVMLAVVLAANLALENFVEPRVMGRSLDIHPLIVLVVTALGGVVGGIVGLILAVPVTVITASAISRLRSGGFFAQVADRAEPAVRRILG
ncbi:AI-2E family transporter [Knoellia sp. 3-2P3]|uniref:AI-2E family transporter n=1 Tax=unclassified Knoellia TaxID=2618719 RepID=UPI0023DA05FD|nr:AI-2E family transporter [Knoellia sp. 3-2P3]MDF2093651.1 AI-2E family transporter [Knoellia sp. 3-2P3]